MKKMNKTGFSYMEKNTAIKNKKQAEELLVLKQFYENILNSLTTGILMLDNNGLLQFINPIGEKLLRIELKTDREKHLNELDFPQKFVDILMASFICSIYSLIFPSPEIFKRISADIFILFNILLKSWDMPVDNKPQLNIFSD